MPYCDDLLLRGSRRVGFTRNTQTVVMMTGVLEGCVGDQRMLSTPHVAEILILFLFLRMPETRS